MRGLLTGFAGAMILVASAIAADAPKDDKEGLVGTWSVESGQRGGENAPDEIQRELKITMTKDGKFNVSLPGGMTEEGTYKFDATKKPKQLTVTLKGKTKEAIYDLDGDKLKLCLDDDDDSKERPAKFESPKGTRIILLTLKRDK